jgi:hypothetical protein
LLFLFNIKIQVFVDNTKGINYIRLHENSSNRFSNHPSRRGTCRNRSAHNLLEASMKRWKAIVSEDQSFDVIGATREIAYANAVNIAAMLFLEYGLALRIQKVVEA